MFGQWRWVNRLTALLAASPSQDFTQIEQSQSIGQLNVVSRFMVIACPRALMSNMIEHTRPPRQQRARHQALTANTPPVSSITPVTSPTLRSVVASGAIQNSGPTGVSRLYS